MHAAKWHIVEHQCACHIAGPLNVKSRFQFLLITVIQRERQSELCLIVCWSSAFEFCRPLQSPAVHRIHLPPRRRTSTQPAPHRSGCGQTVQILLQRTSDLQILNSVGYRVWDNGTVGVQYWSQRASHHLGQHTTGIDREGC